MAIPLVRLVADAAEAGVVIARGEHGSLTLRAPRESIALAKQLRARDIAVLGLYDWRHAAVAEPKPCLLCRLPAILRDPVEHRPAHKVCVDLLIRPAPSKGLDQL
jgi:hypothetical protein